MSLFPLLLLLLPPAAAGNPPNGHWDAGARYAEMEASVRGRVELAIAPLGFLKRQIVRVVLVGATAPCAKVELARAPTEADLSITCDRYSPAVAPANGAQVPVTGDDGRTLRLIHRIDDNGDVVQTFISKHGTRTNRYALQPGAGLRVSVSSHSALPRSTSPWSTRSTTGEQHARHPRQFLSGPSLKLGPCARCAHC